MNIKSVARIAGVSTATVSRVLNGSSTVRDDYKRRVLKAVDELGYRPNRVARNLRQKTASTIGVVVADIENPHFAQMVRTIERVASDGGFRVLLCNSDERASKQAEYLDVLAAERVAGVILSPSDAADPSISALLELGIPIVAVDRVVDDPRVDAIVGNNIRAAQGATQYLLDAKHEAIGFIGGRTEVMTGSERLRGYEDAMKRARLEPHSKSGEFRIEGGRKAAETLLDEVSPTGLVIANNLMTVGALQAISARDLSVPGDLSLVAIDDPPWAALLNPPLTTVAQPVKQMATTAVDILLERIASPAGPVRRIVYDFELRVRGSCEMRRS